MQILVNVWKGWNIDENTFVDYKKKVPFPQQKEIKNSIQVGDDMKGKNQGKNLVIVESSIYEAVMPVSLSEFYPCQHLS